MTGARVTAPCTVGNFGPGFDVLSLALNRAGDTVTLTPSSHDEVVVTGVGAETIPRDVMRNGASAAVDHLRRALRDDRKFKVEIEKGVPPGSGLGSSASSAAAGALAYYLLARGHVPIAQDALLESAAAGEKASTGADHRDDVSAALFGGLAIVLPRPALPVRVEPPQSLRLAVVRPHLVLETRKMRAVLPPAFPREDVVHNTAMVAAILDACHRGDVKAIGRMMDDRIATPYRAKLVTGYAAVRKAALAAGAYGHALSGSGPAQFAVCDSDAQANAVLAEMVDACRATAGECDGFVAAASYRRWENAHAPLH